MNSAETAAAWRILAQRQNSRSGVRNIPPPVPVSPARNPRPAPTLIAIGRDGVNVAADICGGNGKQRKWPKQLPGKMTSPPELERANRCNENIKNKRSWTNDGRCQPEKGHRRDVTGCPGMTDRRIKKSDQPDCEKKKNQMCRVHACHVERSRDISSLTAIPFIVSAKNSQRFLGFGRNDKSVILARHIELTLQRFSLLTI